MRYGSKIVFGAVIALLIAGLFACGKKTETKKTEGLRYDSVIWGDKVKVNLTVTTTGDKYLSGPRPVLVKVPGDCPVKFDEEKYQISRPVFPMSMLFEVPRSLKPGKHLIQLGLTVTFCNKSDDTCNIRNDLLQIPLEVSDKLRPTTGAVHVINVEHTVE